MLAAVGALGAATIAVLRQEQIDPQRDGLLLDDPLSAVDACTAPTEDHIDVAGDCNDMNREVNPDAESIAEELDRELAAGSRRGPLHGVPILLKDNIDTADRNIERASYLQRHLLQTGQDSGAQKN